MLFRAVLKGRGLQSLRDQRCGRTERVQHVERRRMERGGAGLGREIRAFLEHRHRHAGARQMRRGDEPDRARAGNQYAIVAQVAPA